MDPLAFALGLILGGGALGGGVALGRREVVGLRQQIASHAQLEKASIKGLKVEQEALKDQLFAHGRQIGEALIQIEGLRGSIDGQRDALQAFNEEQKKQSEVLVKAIGQLEQLESFAGRAAAEVNELRQRLGTPMPPQPVGYPVMVQQPSGFVMQPQQAQTASAAELINAARSAQEEFARRQRQAMAGAFQQPPGGQ